MYMEGNRLNYLLCPQVYVSDHREAMIEKFQSLVFWKMSVKMLGILGFMILKCMPTSLSRQSMK
jgi:hypothetical protein